MSLSEKTVKWLAENCSQPLGGKTVLITGANSGVGFKTAETMVWSGAAVIMACRDPLRAETAKKTLLAQYPGADISVMLLDLSDFASIDAFARELRQTGRDIDAFVNNAGVFHQPGKTTAQGLEYVMGTNYFGPYRVARTVIPYLRTLGHTVYYINTVSIIHRLAKTDFRDFYCREKYGNLKIYASSKLCLAIFTQALAREEEGGNVRVLMNHPGIAVTPLGLNAYGFGDGPFIRAMSRLFNSPEKSSLSAALILSHSLPDGSLIGPSHVFGGWGFPERNAVSRKVLADPEELIRFTDGEIERVYGSNNRAV